MPGRGAWCQPIACVARSIMFRLRCDDGGIFPLTASAPHEELLNHHEEQRDEEDAEQGADDHAADHAGTDRALRAGAGASCDRSEEHTSELQSLMRISYAVFCLKKKNQDTQTNHRNNQQQNIKNM